MSAKVAQTPGEVVAGNVRLWRTKRSLDQQGLADRLAGLGWNVDRTAIVKIEQHKRKVAVDDLGLLAAALNVPLTVLLIPITGGDVVLSPEGKTATLNRWWLFEWMIGNEPLPGRLPEWRTGAEPLWLYERVRRALEATSTPGDETVEALQELVDAVDVMESAGYPADDLIEPERAKLIKRHKITPTPRPRRFKVGGGR